VREGGGGDGEGRRGWNHEGRYGWWVGLWEGRREGIWDGMVEGEVQPVRGRFRLTLLLRQCRYQGFELEKMLDPDPYPDPE
jgi:hypothetical protein